MIKLSAPKPIELRLRNRTVTLDAELAGALVALAGEQFDGDLDAMLASVQATETDAECFFTSSDACLAGGRKVIG